MNNDETGCGQQKPSHYTKVPLGLAAPLLGSNGLTPPSSISHDNVFSVGSMTLGTNLPGLGGESH